MILAHELGHFLAAKLFGLRVHEFGFGLPPRAWGRQIGETIYSLNWLPFGGFVKIYGEDTAGEASFQSDWSGGSDRTDRSDWSNRSDGSDESNRSNKTDDTSRSFSNQLPWKRSVIILAGVLMNFILGWLLISTALMIGTPKGVYINRVAENSPASMAGIMIGDRVLKYDSVQELIGYISANRGKEINLTVKRGKETLDLLLTPRLNLPKGEGALGVALAEGGERLGFFSALYNGFIITAKFIGFIILALLTLLRGIFTGSADLSNITGPVGIFTIAGSAGALGLTAFMNLFALISINLGVINVIPFPALDGGRFIFILIEKLRGSPLPIKFERLANGLGFAILISLMVLITIRDIRNLS